MKVPVLNKSCTTTPSESFSVVVPIPPTPLALQIENLNLREQLEDVGRVVRRLELEMRGLRWLLANWDPGSEKKEVVFTARPECYQGSGTTEPHDEVQTAVRSLCRGAEPELGYGSRSASSS
ncbi:hypothetical protein EDB85DRAFT_1888167 [Lactarius pseudohatsudake]|nr:hypothetical protein EDB85DRAFT_1888167 [Lactarius pseudohatsudake]